MNFLNLVCFCLFKRTIRLFKVLVFLCCFKQYCNKENANFRMQKQDNFFYRNNSTPIFIF